MAVVKFTAFVSEIRNKVNGSVFSKNRSGNYIRTKVTPVNPQSTAQQLQRGLLTSQSQAWRNLTQAQRDGWAAYANATPYTDIFGDVKFLSGSSMFTKTNLNLLKVGAATLTDAPNPVSLPLIGISAIVATVSTGTGTNVLTITTTADGDDTDVSLAVYATPPVSAGKSFVKNLYKQINVATAAAATKTLTTSYSAIYGSMSVGSKVFVRVQAVSDITGQVGQPVDIMVIVSAVA